MPLGWPDSVLLPLLGTSEKRGDIFRGVAATAANRVIETPKTQSNSIQVRDESNVDFPSHFLPYSLSTALRSRLVGNAGGRRCLCSRNPGSDRRRSERADWRRRSQGRALSRFSCRL